MLTFKVPAGIGDIAWLHGKLSGLGRAYALRICGEEPRRSSPFVSLLHGVKNMGYADFSYHRTFVIEGKGLPVDTDPRELADGEYFLSCNQHVDAGRRIETFLPALPMNFHFSLNLEPAHVAGAEKTLSGLRGPVILVYTSKYNSNGDWTFWGPESWADFLDEVAAKLGGASFIVIGAEFDGDLGSKTARALQVRGHHAVDLVGKTEIGEVMALIQRVDYFFSYPSGLGIMGDVLDTPTMMFLPTPRHTALKDAYADPANVKSGRHLNHLFSSIDQAFQVWKERGLEHLMVRR